MLKQDLRYLDKLDIVEEEERKEKKVEAQRKLCVVNLSNSSFGDSFANQLPLS